MTYLPAFAIAFALILAPLDITALDEPPACDAWMARRRPRRPDEPLTRITT